MSKVWKIAVLTSISIQVLSAITALILTIIQCTQK